MPAVESVQLPVPSKVRAEELEDLVKAVPLESEKFPATFMVLVLGSLSMREFSQFNYTWRNPPGGLTEAERMRRVVTHLQAKGARHVFSMNGLLDSQLMFYSDEKVLARWTPPRGRHPAYGSEVDRALANGKRIAVVGYTNTSGAPGCWAIPICTGGIEHMVANPEAIFTVDDKYFVYVGANKELLQKLGFRFWD